MKKSTFFKKETQIQSYPGAPTTHRINFFGGFIILLIFLIVITLNYICYTNVANLYFQKARITLDNLHKIESTRWLYLLTLFIFTLLFLPVFIKGGYQFSALFKSTLIAMRRNHFPPYITPKFKDHHEFMEQIIHQRPVLPIMSLSDNFLTLIFGNRVTTVHTKEAPIIEEMGQDIKKRLIKGVFWTLSFLFIFWMITKIRPQKEFLFLTFPKSELFFDMIFKDSNRLMIILLLFLIALFELITVFTQLITIHWLLPKKREKMARQKRGFQISEFHHPVKLFQQIPKLAEALCYENFPNKLYGDIPFKGAAEFKNRIFIEQHPQKVRPYHDRSAFLLFLMGWVHQIVAYAVFIIPFLLCMMISRNKILPYHIIGAYIGMGGILLLSDTTKRSSQHFFSLAHHFLSVSYFQSAGIIIELEGRMSESEVTIGSAKTDSVKSFNRVIRSNFYVRLYSAEFLSQMQKKGGERTLLSYHESHESLKWVDYFNHEIHKMAKERLEPAGIDIKSSGFQSLMEANHMFNHLKGIRQLPSQLSLARTFQSKKIENKDPNGKIERRNKTNVIDCPNCFKSGDEDEEACLNCGYSLEETG